MKNIYLKSISLSNFKGCKELSIQFSNPVTSIEGQNATGKTTILDAFLWLLFNKDSQGNSKFGIRPVDSSGKEIDNIEISVEGTFAIDDTEIVLKKVQKQKWTKHRGSAEAVYEGNVNSYEINGFPATEKEYTAKISQIISEDAFKLIADLRYFADLKWTDKKKLLLDLCGDVTDEDVYASDPNHYEPIIDDVRAAGTDAAKAKAKKEISGLNARQKELPIRIDEVRKQIADVPDTSGIDEQIAMLQDEIEILSQKIKEAENDSSSELLEKQKLEAMNQIAAIKSVYQEKSNKIRQDYNKAVEEYGRLKYQKERLEEKISDTENRIHEEDLAFSVYAEKFKEAKGRQFPESEAICPNCGQKLPEGRINQLKAHFEEKRKSDMDVCNIKGKEIRAKKKALELSLGANMAELKELENKIAEPKPIETEDPEILVKSDPEYKEAAERYAYIVDKLNDIPDSAAEISVLIEKTKEAQAKIRELETKKATAEAVKKANADALSRIEELEEEQRDNGQKLALSEQKVILLEEFSMKKSELLSKKITDCFELANFSLFSKQINGGLVEECEITLKGVKYKDMNSGHRIVCAMDIIRTFSEKMGITAPLFIDNAESVNSFNIPEMKCQLILLRVTDDKELTVR